MYKLNILRAIKKVTIKELRDFVHKKCYRQIQSTKEKPLLFNETSAEKKFTILCNQINKNHLILVTPKNTINLFWKEKNKICKPIKNNYSTTKKP